MQLHNQMGGDYQNAFVRANHFQALVLKLSTTWSTINAVQKLFV